MYNTNQRQYSTWAEFLKDVAAFSDDFDYEKSFRMKNFSYFKKSGEQIFAGTFAGFMQSLKNELGLKIKPEGCFDSGFLTVVLFEDYAEELTKAKERKLQSDEENSLYQMSNQKLLELAKEKGLSVKANLNKKQIVTLILEKD